MSKSNVSGLTPIKTPNGIRSGGKNSTNYEDEINGDVEMNSQK